MEMVFIHIIILLFSNGEIKSEFTRILSVLTLFLLLFAELPSLVYYALASSWIQCVQTTQHSNGKTSTSKQKHLGF